EEAPGSSPKARTRPCCRLRAAPGRSNRESWSWNTSAVAARRAPPQASPLGRRWWPALPTPVYIHIDEGRGRSCGGGDAWLRLLRSAEGRQGGDPVLRSCLEAGGRGR